MSTLSESNAFQGTLDKGPVRITIPASVAYDLGALKQGITSLAERLGCSECFSGADCRFQMERDFVINEKHTVVALPQTIEASVDRNPDTQLRKFDYDVHLPKEVSFDINAVHGAIERIMDRLGCKPCSSGFDIFFRQELNVLAVDKNLNVQLLG